MWATRYIEQLNNGAIVQFRPRGNSMLPRIKSGQLCTVIPINNILKPLEINDVVLCTVNSNQYLHLITAINNVKGKYRYQISNNKGRINGIISIDKIHGLLVETGDS